MSKSTPQQSDVLILGQHPCAYLAASMLTQKHARQVVHATLPDDDVPDRLVLLNPALFHLHKPLEKLKKTLPMTLVHGVRFLSSDPGVRGEWLSKTPVTCVASYAEVRKHFIAYAKSTGVKLMTPRSLGIIHVDEQGCAFALDHHTVRARALLLAGQVPEEVGKAIGVAEDFADDVMRRYSFVRLRGTKWAAEGSRSVVPMSLDIDGELSWAWMLPGDEEVQLAVEQPLKNAGRRPAVELLHNWATLLRKHGELLAEPGFTSDAVESIDLPAAGALAREIVGNRTLLFGPAGGFYSACLEDLYPNAWSAVFAADAVHHALQEPHLQDALQPYRQQWGTTLGDYLRGPQQNLRFLLPLVYRNPVMTRRLAESILQGKSVVR